MAPPAPPVGSSRSSERTTVLLERTGAIIPRADSRCLYITLTDFGRGREKRTVHREGLLGDSAVAESRQDALPPGDAQPLPQLGVARQLSKVGRQRRPVVLGKDEARVPDDARNLAAGRADNRDLARH